MTTSLGETPMSNGKYSDEDFAKLFGEEDIKVDDTIPTPKQKQVSVEVKPTQTKNSRFKSENRLFPIWSEVKGVPFISYDMVIEFLRNQGFGVLDKSQLIQIDNNLILNMDVDDITSFLYDYYMGQDESHFSNPNTLGVVKREKKIEDEDGNVKDIKIEYFSKPEVESSIIRFGGFSKGKRHYINKYRSDERVYKKDNKKRVPNLYHMPIFSDNQNEVFTFFENGIVKTTQFGSELVDYGVIDDGYVWDTRIIDTIDNISIDKKRKGIFEDFVEKTMMYKDEDGKWVLDDKEYESLRTIYGYLLSNYTNNGFTPCPIFVDRDSDGQHAEGGNGKSLVMRSVRHWKKSYEIAGRGIDPSSSRFLFSGVQLDTGFVWIDDAEKDFDFQRLYNYTTGDMEIERKNKDRISLSLETKPKLGITTNYILPDTDGSTRRRQYVVEFGSYWHDLKEKDKEPKDVYGKQFFGYSFSDDDWLDFYNFGFRCVEEFLRKGVILNNRSNYRRKQLISQIEGAGINDGVCEWIQDYVVDNETNFKSKDGIPFDNIYGDFTKHFEEDIIENWSSNRFKKSLFDICQEKKWNYNPHKSHRGSRLSDRRFLTGPKGQQIESVRIELPITEKVT